MSENHGSSPTKHCDQGLNLCRLSPSFCSGNGLRSRHFRFFSTPLIHVFSGSKATMAFPTRNETDRLSREFRSEAPYYLIRPLQPAIAEDNCWILQHRFLSQSPEIHALQLAFRIYPRHQWSNTAKLLVSWDRNTQVSHSKDTTGKTAARKTLVLVWRLIPLCAHSTYRGCENVLCALSILDGDPGFAGHWG